MADLPFELAEALKDRYRLERELGRGGMATVYLAEDLKHERQVALKVLLPELAHSLGVDRFQREIKLAARLQHPHILSVHDSGEAAGQFWFTMPFVDGESLRERLRREGRLPVDDALRIAREAAQALQYAHERGVVHRDVKPENILLTSDGSTLVADFGIARALGERGGPTTQLTQTGTSIGTPQYMAPEQATGQHGIDPRADQYALAVVLYEMLTGEPPFTAANAGALIATRFTQSVPSVRAKRPEVPPTVEQALFKALSLKAEDRFTTIADLARDIAPPGMSSGSTPALSAATAVLPAPAPKRRVPAVALLGVGLLIGMGVLFAWRGGQRDAGPKALAVLPFENLGDTTDAYFADGITDELRGKLTGVADLEVIARSSSLQYRGSTKPAQQIAKELGVRYLLTGTVRWEKAGDGKGRVRVSPELIEVGSSGRPASRWQQAFDAPITDVFQVQSGIAEQVVQALDVALGGSVQQDLARAPTGDLVAYDAYLKGEAILSTGANDPASLRRAIAFYEQAVARDSTFAPAWSRLAICNGLLYSNSTPSPATAAMAKRAVDRAKALAPGQPEAVIAEAQYYRVVMADFRKAQAVLAPALARSPYNVELLRQMASAEREAGQLDAAVRHQEQAVRLDPRAPSPSRSLGISLLWLRRYDDAAAALERAIELAPNSMAAYHARTLVELARGDLAAARRVLERTIRSTGDTNAVLAYFTWYSDLYWLLDDAQQRQALALPESAFDVDRGAWAIVRAQLHGHRGDAAAARAWGDTAQHALAIVLKDAPNDGQRHGIRGLALAYAGRFDEAIAEGRRGVELLPTATNPYVGSYVLLLLSRIYVMAGRPEPAIDQLESVLKVPNEYGPGWFRIDPAFAPLKGNPRFEKLVAAR